MKNKLKQKREQKNITQKEVAKLAGISFRAYQNYEAGLQVPSVEVAIVLAKVFKTTVEKLFIQE